MLCRYCFPGIALSINDQYCYHIQTSKLICKAYQLAGFYIMRVMIIKPFLAIAPILYHLKTPENLCSFWCFQGVSNWKISQKLGSWFKKLLFFVKPFRSLFLIKFRKCCYWKIKIISHALLEIKSK